MHPAPGRLSFLFWIGLGSAGKAAKVIRASLEYRLRRGPTQSFLFVLWLLAYRKVWLDVGSQNFPQSLQAIHQLFRLLVGKPLPIERKPDTTRFVTQIFAYHTVQCRIRLELGQRYLFSPSE